MAWITTEDGRRVNTDWFTEDERKKYRQIEENQKQADELNGKKQKDERNKPIIEPAKPTKNAEEAFKYIYRNARKLSKGEDADKIDTIAGGFSYKGDDTPVLSIQALKGIQSRINSTRGDIRLDVELGIITKEQGIVESSALDIVQRTLNEKVRGMKGNK